jgi:hypothetical protein
MFAILSSWEQLDSSARMLRLNRAFITEFRHRQLNTAACISVGGFIHFLHVLELIFFLLLLERLEIQDGIPWRT